MSIADKEQSAGMSSLKQVKISVNEQIAFEFKAACSAAELSMAVVLSRYMADYAKIKPVQVENEPDYSSRRLRREAIKDIVRQLEAIRDEEERYRDNIPQNLRGSVRFENAEELIALLDDAIDALTFE